MGTVLRDQLVTIEDLEKFKIELVNIIRQILAERNPKTEKKWLKTSEARKVLGFSPGKLQAVRDSGALAFTKIGGNIYYDYDDLMKLFDERKKIKK